MWTFFAINLCVSSSWAQETVQDVYRTLSTSYAVSGLEEAAIQGMLEHIDRQTGISGSQMMTRSDFTAWNQWKHGERDGYGLRIQVLEGRGFVIEHVMENSPAALIGLQQGDFVVSLNTRSLSGLSAEQMLRILDQEGVERLIVEVLRDGEIQTLKMQRGIFSVSDVDTIAGNTISIPFFGEGSAEQIEKHLRETSKTIEPILDLRDNSGGLWEEAIETLDLFFAPQQVLAHRQYYDGTTIPILSQAAKVQAEPIVILINQGTKGPAELVALTLQENGMATLVGERSAGYGLDYHVVYPKSGKEGTQADWVLLMADTRLLSSKKQNWNQSGVVPNLAVSAQHSYRGEDRQLQTAIQLVSSH